MDGRTDEVENAMLPVSLDW